MGGEAGQPDAAPWLPPGRYVWLPGRGRTFVRELAGPPGAPTLILLHGWTATADLNWFACFAPARRALPRRRPRPSRPRPRPALDRAVPPRALRRRRRRARSTSSASTASSPVGYSMGGPIAQLVWQRHRELVDGLVLCATSAHVHRHDARAAAVRRRRRHQRRRRRRADRPGSPAPPSARWNGWRHRRGSAVVGVRRGRPPRLGPDRRGRAGDRAVRLAARGSATSTCRRRSSSPTTTTSCRCTASWRSPTGCRQASLWRVAGGHAVCTVAPERFVPALVAACTAVAGRRSPIGVMALAA